MNVLIMYRDRDVLACEIRIRGEKPLRKELGGHMALKHATFLGAFQKGLDEGVGRGRRQKRNAIESRVRYASSNRARPCGAMMGLDDLNNSVTSAILRAEAL